MLLTNGAFAGSPDDLRDEFIHFSSKAQVEKTLNKHFSSEDELILAEVLSSSLNEAALKWEVSTAGALYPHLYDKMHLSTVTKAWPIERGTDGQFDLPIFNETTPIFEGRE